MNPWLSIPAFDYEGHMSSPEVDQLEYLRTTFGRVLKKHNPSSIAVVGCATGNGFDMLDNRSLTRVYALDINPEYLSVLRDRYRHLSNIIQPICCDLDREAISLERVDLVHAALVFEFVRPDPLLKQISNWLANSGILSCVLQTPSDSVPPVTPSPFRSIESLSSHMHLVDPDHFKLTARSRGMLVSSERSVRLHTGKMFLEIEFRKERVRGGRPDEAT